MSNLLYMLSTWFLGIICSPCRPLNWKYDCWLPLQARNLSFSCPLYCLFDWALSARSVVYVPPLPFLDGKDGLVDLVSVHVCSVHLNNQLMNGILEEKHDDLVQYLLVNVELCFNQGYLYPLLSFPKAHVWVVGGQ